MLKKALPRNGDRSQIEPRTGIPKFYVNTKELCNALSVFTES